MLIRRFMRRSQHDCAREQKFEPSLNQPVVHFGVVWQCPDCGAFWYRDIEHTIGLDLVFYAKLGKADPSWQRLTRRQTKKLHKLVVQQKNLTSLEVADRMGFKRQGRKISCYPADKDGIKHHNQAPSSWIFS